MRVSAYEELWRICHYLPYNATIVTTRIATYMLHKYLHILTLKTQHILKHQAQVATIAIATVVGGLLGAIAGYGSRRVDDVIMRVMDIFLAIPSILLSIALVSAMGTSVTNMMLAISISNIPPFARIVRSAVLTIKNEEYIEAARAIGASDKRIILKHILPNCMAPIIVQATLSIAGSILAIASLSFIGLGISPPTPEWGSMVSTGRQYFRAAWWVCAFPGFAIMLTILSLNLLGDGLRDALDPKLKN